MLYEYRIEALTTNAHKDSADLTRVAAEWGGEVVTVYWAGARREALLRCPVSADKVLPTALAAPADLPIRKKPGRKPKVQAGG